jgi:hypothetical protein
LGFLLLGVSDMAYKVCPKCKKELPATSEYFYKQSRSKDGLTTYDLPPGKPTLLRVG